MNRGKRRWIGTVALVLAGIAALGIGGSFLLLSSWSEVRQATPQEAEQAFGEVLARLGDPPAYLEISPAGTVKVHRELERPRPVGLAALELLAWDPKAGRLVEVAFPFWFVRLKMSDTLNLGTLTSALAGDWRHLDLRVSERDLERLGPGLVLDQSTTDGARLLLWTRARTP